MTRVDSRPPDCIDGETLAAWSSGSLRPADAAAVEEHLSNCERCQAMLATFVRIEPPPALAHSVWRRWHLQWLVPLATAATVAAVWVAIPQESQQPIPVPAAEESAPGNLPPTLPTPAPEASAARVAPDSRRLEDRSELAQQRGEPKELDEEQQKKVGNLGRERAAAKANERADAKATDTFAPVPAAPQPAEPLPQALAREGRRAQTVPPPPAELEARQEAVALGGALADASRRLIVSPEPSHQWRISGGQVDYSSTGGKQWERVLTSGSDRLTAGHSPSPTVVWLVGPAGAVYVTSDGAKFEKVPFIEPVDLVSVVAIDNRQATVATADGRAFQTMDRGLTWRRVK